MEPEDSEKFLIKCKISLINLKGVLCVIVISGFVKILSIYKTMSEESFIRPIRYFIITRNTVGFT